jgi:hypothetical protein
MLHEAACQQATLKRGESVEDVRRLSSTPVGRGSSFAYAAMVDCAVEVTIRLADAGVEMVRELSVTVPGAIHDEGFKARAEAQVRTALRLRKSEQLLGHSYQAASTKTRSKMVASKGRTTRYVVRGAGRHDTFETGFATLAAAKAYAKSTEVYASRSCQSISIEGVIRDGGGAALATRHVEVISTTITVRARVVIGRRTPTSVDGWVFFGWASC